VERITHTDLNKLALEMAGLFKNGHDVEQTPEYEAIRRTYLLGQVALQWQDTGYIPPSDHIVG